MAIIRNIICTLLVGFSGAIFAIGQGVDRNANEVGPIRSSAAYAEIALRRAELEADIESFIQDYTEQNPKVLDARNELKYLVRDLDRLFTIKPTETDRLTPALGRLIVRRAALEADVERLLRSYGKDHPNVRKARRKAEIFETAIREILG